MIISGIISVKAQTNTPKYQFGVSLGTFVYMGDLTPSSVGSYKTLKPSLNLFAAKLLSPSFAIRGNLALGKLKGDDAKYDHPDYRQQRNFYFTSPIIELSALAEWSILGKNYASRGFSPYVFAGLGFSFLNIKRDWSRFNTAYFGDGSEILTGLVSDAQHSLPNGLLTVPIGVGVRYYINDRIGVSAETSYRVMSTDYLDGFSQSANPGKTDHYGLHSIGIVYRTGKKNTLACPEVRY